MLKSNIVVKSFHSPIFLNIKPKNKEKYKRIIKMKMKHQLEVIKFLST